MNPALHRGKFLFPFLASSLVAAEMFSPGNAAGQARTGDQPDLRGAVTTPAATPLVEPDPNFYACRDPLTRAILTGQTKAPGAITAIRRDPARVDGEPGAITYEGAGLDPELRDGLHSAPATGDLSLPPSAITGGDPSEALQDASGEPAAEAPSEISAEERSPAAKDRMAHARKATDQLEAMSRRTGKICAGSGPDKDCVDGTWGEQRPASAADAPARPQKRTSKE